jgi:hypothetical protein
MASVDSNTCPLCGSSIDEAAGACPTCGENLTADRSKPPDYPRRSKWLAYGVPLTVVLGVLLLPYLYFALVMHFTKPSEVRIAYPAERQLTEQEAIELSKRALDLDGKRSDGMHPVASGHKDSEGRDIIVLRSSHKRDTGKVLSWLERPDCTWEYSVGISRERDEVVCTISEGL